MNLPLEISVSATSLTHLPPPHLTHVANTPREMCPPPHGPGHHAVIAVGVVVGIATITVALRFWARWSIRALGLDDWLMLVGWALLLFQPIAVSMSHVGYHRDELSESEYMSGKKWHFITGIIYTANSAIIKSSICVFMLRIAREKWHRFSLWAVGVLVVTGSIIRIVVWLLRCTPIEASWDPSKEQHCFPLRWLTRVSIYYSVLCIFTDLVCALLPVWIVWKLQLCRTEKTYVSIMLAFGLSASIAPMVRFKYLFNYQDKEDSLHSIHPIAILSALELALGVMGACIATMRPLLRYIPFPKTKNRSRETGGRPHEAIRMRRLNLEDTAGVDHVGTQGRQAGNSGESEVPQEGNSGESEGRQGGHSGESEISILPQHQPSAGVKREPAETRVEPRHDSLSQV